MAAKNITVLRNHLFEQLERLTQATTKEEVDLEVNKASSIVSVSDALLRTAQVEATVISTGKILATSFIPDVIEDIKQKQVERNKIPYEFQKPKDLI